MDVYEKIPLSNGLVLIIWDNSREIAADTTKVELVAQMEVTFEPASFSRREDYDKLVRTLGSTGLFEYRKARAFVKTAQSETVFQGPACGFQRTYPALPVSRCISAPVCHGEIPGHGTGLAPVSPRSRRS